MQRRLPAVFVRGGTSKALVFREHDLPPFDRAVWTELFLAALGSPDLHGRQLNGMGGGISSLSKVCVVGPSTRPDADVDYTFAQVSVRNRAVDFGGNCGNISAAVGPFAVDEGMVAVADTEQACVRIHNTNTSKIVESHFPIARFPDGQVVAITDGDYETAGVSGRGAALRLDFLDPGGAISGELLPTGNAIDTLDTPTLGKVDVSLVDASALCVFVDAHSIGLLGDACAVLPAELEADTHTLQLLQQTRAAAAVRMGMAENIEQFLASDAATPTNRPAVGFVSGARAARTISGAWLGAEDADVTARVISMGDPHRALPGTCAMCLAVAAQIEGSVVHRHAKEGASTRRSGQVRLMHPSGIVDAAATVRRDARARGGWVAEKASLYRTQRRLFEGNVCLPTVEQWQSNIPDTELAD